MPLFKVSETRYVHTEQVADIEYLPASEEADILPAQESHLRIELRGEGEEIQLSGKEADTVWAVFQEAISQQAKEAKES